ncbi:MAG: phage tail tape measure protein, partial [Oscillospiraceae bacterium]|nr:phage tail tape measure protein [Oscillospiraceae bacterium]
MASGKTLIRQIFAQFRLDTTDFQQKSKEIKEGMSRLGTQVKDLQAQLKIQWDNEKYNQAMATAAERTKLAEDKVTMFREELDRTKKALASVAENSDEWGTLNRRVQELEKDLIKAETAAVKAAKELKDMGGIPLERITAEMKKVGDNLNNLKDRLNLKWDNATYVRAMAEAKDQTRLAAERVQILREEMSKLEAAGIDKSSDEWKRLKNEITEAETAAVKAAAELGNIAKLSTDHLATELGKAGDNLEAVGKKASIASAALAAGFAFGVKSAVDMETAMAGVSKTTDLVGDELQEMRQDIIDLSKEIPAAATELAKIAETAGQLGVANEHILEYTETIAALKTVTNLTAVQGATDFAKFANITQMAQENVDRLGSSVFALDKSTATTASSIMEMALRLASAGHQAGMTEAEIIGIAGALSSVGLESQAGGTAFSKTITMIQTAVETGSDDLKNFADVAGMSAEKFAAAWRSNAASALLAFTQGLGDTGRLGQSTIVTLEALGLTEVRLSDALRRIAGSGDTLTNALEISKNAWAENTALADGAAVAYDTTAGKLQIAKNQVTELGIQLGDHFLPVIADVTKGVGDFAGWLIDLDEKTGGLVTKVGIFTAVFGPASTGLGKAAGGVAELIAKIGTWIAANTAATASQTTLNAAVAATPWGAIGTAIGLVLSAVAGFAAANTLVTTSASEAADALSRQTEE